MNHTYSTTEEIVDLKTPITASNKRSKKAPQKTKIDGSFASRYFAAEKKLTSKLIAGESPKSIGDTESTLLKMCKVMMSHPTHPQTTKVVSKIDPALSHKEKIAQKANKRSKKLLGANKTQLLSKHNSRVLDTMVGTIKAAQIERGTPQATIIEIAN